MYKRKCLVKLDQERDTRGRKMKKNQNELMISMQCRPCTNFYVKISTIVNICWKKKWKGASNRLQKNRLRWGCRNSLHSEQKLASASRLIRGESSNAEKSQRFEFDLLERLISRSPRDLIWEYNLKTLPPMFSWNSRKQSAHLALFRRKKLWNPHSQLFKFVIASFSANAAFDKFVSLLNCRKWYRLLCQGCR